MTYTLTARKRSQQRAKEGNKVHTTSFIMSKRQTNKKAPLNLKREFRLRKCKINIENNKMLLKNLKPKENETTQAKKQSEIKPSIKKHKVNSNKLLNQKEGKKLKSDEKEDKKINIVSEDILQPLVKQEPILELDDEATDFKEKNQLLEDSIELDIEVKVEYDCSTDGEVITDIKPILIKNTKEDEASFKTNEANTLNHPPLSSFKVQSSGTKFSKMPSIKTKDEALKCIRLLESFALYKENIRLIGFVERLQNHFEKIS